MAERGVFSFQSTRPMRGATRMMMAERGVFSFQSTRPMRGATLHAATLAHFGRISIHAPHAGRDADDDGGKRRVLISIHAPHAGRDADDDGRKRRVLISIHAPHAGRDFTCCNTRPFRTNFNPRAPCGARLRYSLVDSVMLNFNPRAPCGARLPISELARAAQIFQSTRPMRGATIVAMSLLLRIGTFQSTRPMRGATASIILDALDSVFQSTRPMRGATTWRG